MKNSDNLLDRAKDNNCFWQFGTDYWLNKLNSSLNGLSQSEAERIISGSKQSVRDKSSLYKDATLLLSQFKSPLMLLLVGAVIVSYFLGDQSDVFIILFIILSSGFLSFFQERNAGKTVEKLQSLISHKTTALRDGVSREIPSKYIVPGDIILLSAGDMLPADCLLLESNELNANESSLTGESYPASKETGVLDAETPLAQRTNCLWEGSNIISGNAKALVIYIGENTIFGKMSGSVLNAVETTFEKEVKDYGFFLMRITLSLSLFILTVNLLGRKDFIESALFALALAIGMAPELLPAITTIAMSAGAKRLLDKKVIVKKLNAIQNLGEVDLICTDKTGTVTEGKITISGAIDPFGDENDFVKQLACWNAFFETGYTNPIDDALRQLDAAPNSSIKKIGEIPYDFIRKRLSVAVNNAGDRMLITKGAYVQIAQICDKIRTSDGRIERFADSKEIIERKFAALGEQGLRAIALCYNNIAVDKITKDLESEMIFAGFILFTDPIKPDIKQILAELSKLNVGLKIITGDNKNIAKSIARDIGFDNPKIITGKELFHTSPEALTLLSKNIDIFAEIEPQQKERIILSLKKSFCVAYIGDGVNDVSAINAADVGISVENAVDVAKEAADFVLMEKELMVLADGVLEGRKTFANTLKYLYINTGATFGNMCSVAAASLILPFLPMLPKQILLTNFLTNLPFLAISADNVDKEQLIKPGKWNLKVIRQYMVIFGVHSSVFDLITFLVLYFILNVKENEFQTGWFIESTISQLFILYIIRTHKQFFRSKPGKYLVILGAAALIITLLFPYFPFSREVGLVRAQPLVMLSVMVIALVYIFTADILKVWFFRKYNLD